MKNPIGCSTVMFGGELPEKLAAMRAAGFSHTEITSRDLFETLQGPEYALSVLRDSGLAVSCLQLIRDFEGAPRDSLERKLGIIEHVMDQALFAGTDLLVLCASTLADASADEDTICEDLRRLADLAKSKNLRIAWEPIAWATWYHDFRAAWRIVRKLDHANLGLVIDTTHIGILQQDFDEVRQIDPAKIFLVEIADLAASRLGKREQSRYYRLLPGEGVLELEKLVGALKDIGYQGVLSLEIFSDHYRHLPPALAAREGYQAMRQLLDRSDRTR